MRKTFLTVFATTAILSGGLFGVEAIPLASSSALGFAAGNADLIQRVTVVCGNNGCSPVQTKRVQRRQPLKH
jgi:hypothetical protein